ncbi:CynX/NimT family MFS transporter [Mycolicibacterium brumae]|uniref:MFS transporter n=1 Tax=Mycolicibacterium brumae TaxID=85968 RepID=A0A2G5P441_9MYCO|nr:MFS transporter [Mycolicibacterium brumae]MCV7193437.1 MFS transporter [Mycolicibacterium brumae]PIB73142.1 MFS transporter [Mycolicibacterium brumae]UWW09290.1 MFS transporter [Mycolicibacterium brumae]
MAAGGGLLVTAVVLAALNMRPVVNSVGPVLGDIRADLGTSAVWAGVLTMLPVLCFSGAGLAAPWLARRLGLGRTIAVALAVLTVGAAVRVLGGPGVVLAGTLAACAGIALANVLIPVVIKGSFPTRIGVMTGVYSAALQGGGALGSAGTPFLADALGGWRPALASWAVLAALAWLFWVLGANRIEDIRPAETARGSGVRGLLRNPLAWTVTVFFGCQSFLAYVIFGWLPEVFIDNGISQRSAGLLLGLISVLAVPVSLFIIPLAAQRRSQSGWIIAMGVTGIAGIVGLLVAPAAAPVLWSLLVGFGLSAFSMALAVIALRARDAETTASLSGMAQGIGYLFAGLGPLMFGVLHEVTGSWTVPWLMVLAVYLVQVGAGTLAGRDRQV